MITGAGSGIGAETAKQFARAGSHVGVIDRNEQRAAEVVRDITDAGGSAIALPADISSEADVRNTVTQITSRFGACDVLVNNAAVSSGASLLKVGLEDWNRLFAVNLTGALICTQAFGVQMAKENRGGCIINVGSITGLHPMPCSGGYSISKAALSMFSRVLMLELASNGVRVNTVIPGLIRTPATEGAYADPSIAQARRRLIPVGMEGRPEEVAEVIVMLASDRTKYISGQEIVVDGGLSQTLMSLMPRVRVRRD
ncbi:3-beta-hydroxysteroid dehydrogenase [Caballeronia temeraria]|uniref:3-beta-hydroxysteroid dehydrogenase n=1 Tax=Caballeronia temeraria TaxID=1777137 RepID=A0A158DKI9_9BURK|nr:3-beta-hydroxysteroid dehydrogenase [Caballeronia temeraria]